MKRIVVVLAFVTSLSALASPKNNSRREHPRRAQVHHREQNQMRRIEGGVKSGKLSEEQARQLRGEVSAIKQEQREAVKANGGYLTKEQQKELNQDLNKTSKEIYQAKHPNVATPQAPAATNGH